MPRYVITQLITLNDKSAAFDMFVFNLYTWSPISSNLTFYKVFMNTCPSLYEHMPEYTSSDVSTIVNIWNRPPSIVFKDPTTRRIIDPNINIAMCTPITNAIEVLHGILLLIFFTLLFLTFIDNYKFYRRT